MEWRAFFEEAGVHDKTRPTWHIPTDEEMQFANEIVQAFLYPALDQIELWCNESKIGKVHKDDLKWSAGLQLRYPSIIIVGDIEFSGDADNIMWLSVLVFIVCD